MSKVKDIVKYFEDRVPPEMKMEGDNVGLLVGLRETVVTKAVVALDITPEVIEEAASFGAQIILSHHPLFFDLSRINDDCFNGCRITKLIQNGISAFCQHTNLDQVNGGVNTTLAIALGIEIEGFLSDSFTAKNGESYGMGRFGNLKAPTDMVSFLPFVKSVLKTDGLRFYDAGRPVKRVGVVGGTGGKYVERALQEGCDTVVTADIKHSEFLLAKHLGMNLIDGGHYCTENLVVPILVSMLTEGFPEIEVRIAESAGAPACFYMG